MSLDTWARLTQRRVLVVFDGPPRPEVPAGDRVGVRFAGAGRDAADDVIARLVAEATAGSGVRAAARPREGAGVDDGASGGATTEKSAGPATSVTVVTSDARLARRLQAHGAEIVSAGRFRSQIERGWAIRRASPADAPAVSDVLTAAGVAAWGAFLGVARIEAANRNRHHPADLVAVDDEGVFGFVAWDAATGEILRLYTHPRAWGRGAGRELLQTAIDRLREAGCGRAWLNTEARNERARRFYERQGWRREGPPRVRVWHGVDLCEPRYVKEL